MARVLSALVLLPLVIGTVWFLPPVATLALACVAALLAFVEYAGIVRASDVHVPRLITAITVVAACIAVGTSLIGLDLLLMSAVIVLGALAVATGTPRPRVLHDAAASLFAVIYIGLPLGALAAVRALAGREAILLLMVTIVISDSAQVLLRARLRAPAAVADDQPEENRRRSDRRTGVRNGGDDRWRAVGLCGRRPPAACSRQCRRRRAGYRRRSLRVAAQAERGRQGFIAHHSGARRRARPDRQLAVRRANLLRVRALPPYLMKNIAIVGSTGSIGQSALSVVDSHPGRLRVVALAAGENTGRFVDQVAATGAGTIAMASEPALAEAQAELQRRGASPVVHAASGPDGLIAVATHPDAELVLFASTGTAALEAVLAAIEAEGSRCQEVGTDVCEALSPHAGRKGVDSIEPGANPSDVKRNSRGLIAQQVRNAFHRRPEIA